MDQKRKIPTARSKEKGGSGKMAASMMDQAAVVDAIEKNMTPEGRWTEEGEKRSHGGVIALVLSALFFIALAGLGIWYAQKGSQSGGQKSAISGTAAMDLDGVRLNRFAESLSVAQIDQEIRRTIDHFFKADSLEAASQWVVGGEAVLPKMRRYYQRHPGHRPDKEVVIEKINSITMKGIPFHGASITWEDLEKSLIFSMMPGKDRMLIEWESSTSYGDLSQEEFFEQKPAEEIEARVQLRKLPDRSLEPENRDFQLNYRDDLTAMDFALPENSDALLAEIREIVLDSKLRYPVTVKMRWNADQRLPEITEILHTLWIDFERYLELYPE